MALFGNHDKFTGTGKRLKGMPRYSELLGRDFGRFFLVNLLTLLGFLPYAAGVLFSLFSGSILVLIPSSVFGGIIAGPALSCMYDCVYRSFRDAPGSCMENYKKAWKQNFRSSVIPGILFCLILGFYAFMAALLWWQVSPPAAGTYIVYAIGFILFTAFFTVYWPLVALFEQSGKNRFMNCMLFFIRYFWKVLGCALLQILYWAVFILFLPWSVIALPLIGIWFIVFTVNFLLFDTMNQVFRIEEEIAKSYPEQAALYEDDEEWLKRKQEENHDK